MHEDVCRSILKILKADSKIKQYVDSDDIFELFNLMELKGKDDNIIELIQYLDQFGIDVKFMDNSLIPRKLDLIVQLVNKKEKLNLLINHKHIFTKIDNGFINTDNEE